MREYLREAWTIEGVLIMSVAIVSVLFCSAKPEGEQEDESTTKFSEIHTVLTQSCGTSSCHTAGGEADLQGAYVLTGDIANDYETLIANTERVNTSTPLESNLLKKPTYESTHGGGEVFVKESAEYSLFLKWIQDGAKND